MKWLTWLYVLVYRKVTGRTIVDVGNKTYSVAGNYVHRIR